MSASRWSGKIIWPFDWEAQHSISAGPVWSGQVSSNLFQKQKQKEKTWSHEFHRKWLDTSCRLYGRVSRKKVWWRARSARLLEGLFATACLVVRADRHRGLRFVSLSTVPRFSRWDEVAAASIIWFVTDLFVLYTSLSPWNLPLAPDLSNHFPECTNMIFPVRRMGRLVVKDETWSDSYPGHRRKKCQLRCTLSEL